MAFALSFSTPGGRLMLVLILVAIDDLEEIGLQRRAPYEEPVHIRLCRKLVAVSGGD